MGEGISAEKAYEIHQLFHGVRCPDAPDPARLVSYMEDGKMKIPRGPNQQRQGSTA